MRVYVGTFIEDEIDEVMGDLRGAGVGCDIRNYLDATIELKYFVEGDIKELKEKYKEGIIAEAILDVEKKIEAAREIFKEGMEIEYFDNIFLEKFLPERKKYEEIKKSLNIAEMPDGLSIIPWIAEQTEEKQKEIIEKLGEENFNKYILQWLKELDIIKDIHTLLINNGVEHREGKMYGKIADNLSIRRYFDVSDEEADKLGLKKEYTIEVFKNSDVYANMLDVLYEIDRVKKLCEEKPRYGKLFFMLTLVDEILGKLKGKKFGINEIVEEMMEIYRKDEEGEEEILIEEEAIKEILKVMEKAEIIKIKNEKVMPK
ncbi:MAG: hypothetical protein H5T44_02495 [Thermoplasmatales archaeon]|nr:hypothetical protein [Thermoplasmatales archaeon]